MSSSCAYNQPLNHTGKIAYACTSAFSGSLSIIGSSLIIWIVLKEGQIKLSQVRNRLLFCRSIIDIFYSIALGLSINLTPQETACSIGLGNLSTCNAQGFFIQFGFAIQAYTAMVSIYYLLTVRYGITPTKVAQKYELFMHTYALIPPITTAIIGSAKNMYFNETTPCWIGDICRSLGNCPDGNIWGRGLWIVAASSLYSLVNFLIIIYCMLALFFTLRKRDLIMKRSTFWPTSGHVVQNSRLTQMEIAAKEAFKQAYLYVFASVSVYIWVCCAMLLSFIDNGETHLPVWFILLAATFQPLLGFWNFLIFLQPIISIARLEEGNNNLSLAFVLYRIIRGAQSNPYDSNRELDPPIDITVTDGGSISQNRDPTEQGFIVNIAMDNSAKLDI